MIAEAARGALPGIVVAAVVLLLLAACGPSARKLDEAVFHDGRYFRLKLVRYYENLPLHYTGEVFRVQCASVHTADSPAHRTQEAGWVTLGNGGAIGSRSATELVERERGNYIVLDEQTLVWTGNGLNISFDACGQFRGWYPTSLPPGLIDPVDKPSYCAPRGTADCRNHDFMGDRAPRFENIQVRGSLGEVSFVVRSGAFRDVAGVRVRSTDFGRTWDVVPLAGHAQ